MITLEQWLKAIKYRITEGSDYNWESYGPNAYSLDYWDQLHNGVDTSIIIDKLTGIVYQCEVCDYEKNVAYRIINPAFKDSHIGEAEQKNLDHGYVDEAWENVPYCDSEVDDFLEKLHAIVNHESYDTRSSVSLDLDEKTTFTLMKMAHEKDITFNQLICNILNEVFLNPNTT